MDTAPSLEPTITLIPPHCPGHTSHSWQERQPRLPFYEVVESNFKAVKAAVIAESGVYVRLVNFRPISFLINTRLSGNTVILRCGG